jgi:hypothetical protein
MGRLPESLKAVPRRGSRGLESLRVLQKELVSLGRSDVHAVPVYPAAGVEIQRYDTDSVLLDEFPR